MSRQCKSETCFSSPRSCTFAKRNCVERARFIFLSLVCAWAAGAASIAADAFQKAEIIFPLEHWHNHASCIVEAPNGDLIVCWFHGSGERTADDVKIEGARLRKGSLQWSKRFDMADTPGYPDTNCTMFIDPEGRLWLLYPTILANRWESALMKYRISSDYLGDGAPRWDLNEVLHVTPGDDFEKLVMAYLQKVETDTDLDIPAEYKQRLPEYIERLKHSAKDKLTRRLGWMTRAHPIVLDQKRLIVPLYSDGFSFSLMAFTDDWGKSWHTSTPLVGPGNIQPSIVQRKDGSLYTLMRDNGPAPKRLHQSESKDRGETWSPVTDSSHPNPGSGAEVIKLKNGNWALISNDLERGRYSLAVQLSDDEGKTWKWKRHLERDSDADPKGEYHYPSIIQASDGTLHASYSYHLKETVAGGPNRKTIKHAHFNEEWVKAVSGATP
jgi:predicted neuraminidase